MRYAADLHIHSHYSAAVSKYRTVETIGRHARIKGMDVIGTGDCLQREWLTSLEGNLMPAESGWFILHPKVEARIAGTLSSHLHQPLRFVLSTEVHCVSSECGDLRGIHHLLYFSSFESAHHFRRKIEPYGDLSEGRPTLTLTSRELLEIAIEQGCEMAPAHVMNPYFSSLGVQENHQTLVELFGDLTTRLFAVETGLTSTPEMCRRLSSLDSHALFSCSDAHSPENIGRECTILETDSGFTPMMAALRNGSCDQVLQTLKFPLPCTRYYLNRCGTCAKSFEGARCPECQKLLVMGSRDRLEQIADRSKPEWPSNSPPFQMLLPLRYLLSELFQTNRTSRTVNRFYDTLIEEIGHERFILTEADYETLARTCPPQVARAIVDQRHPNHVFLPLQKPKTVSTESQPALF